MYIKDKNSIPQSSFKQPYKKRWSQKASSGLNGEVYKWIFVKVPKQVALIAFCQCSAISEPTHLTQPSKKIRWTFGWIFQQPCFGSKATVSLDFCLTFPPTIFRDQENEQTPHVVIPAKHHHEGINRGIKDKSFSSS